MLNNITDIARYLTDEKAAGELIQRFRWPNGVACPLCGHDKIFEVKGPNPDRKQWKCSGCRKKFSVTSRSIFEASKIPLGKWVYAIWSMCSHKKGVSANQLHRELNINYRSAWFMCHRIREAMKQEPLAGMLGAGGQQVELDETFVGGKKRNNRHRNRTEKAGKKTAVMTMVERNDKAKTAVIPNVRRKTLHDMAKPVVDKSAVIMTDAHVSYEGLEEHFAAHKVVDHATTYVRGVVHTNFAESYHSLLKRGGIGTFHNVSDKHLGRYLYEFDNRWNARAGSDGQNAQSTIQSAAGRRLMYKNLIN